MFGLGLIKFANARRHRLFQFCLCRWRLNCSCVVNCSPVLLEVLMYTNDHEVELPSERRRRAEMFEESEEHHTIRAPTSSVGTRRTGAPRPWFGERCCRLTRGEQ